MYCRWIMMIMIKVNYTNVDQLRIRSHYFNHSARTHIYLCINAFIRVEVPFYLYVVYDKYIVRVCTYVALRCWRRCYHAFKAVRAMKKNGWELFTYWKDKNSSSNDSSRQLCCALWPSSLGKDGSAITGLDEYHKNRANRCVCMRRMSYCHDYSLFMFHRRKVDHFNSTINMSLLNSSWKHLIKFIIE